MNQTRIGTDSITLNAFLDRKRRSLRLPGLAVGIIKGDQVVYLHGSGQAAAGQPITSHTPLIIGSLSKSFTALAIMQLAEASALDLDAPVQQSLPWFRVANPVASAQITIRHLLTHTSGFSRFDGRKLLASQGNNTLEQSVRELRHMKLAHPVGKRFEYSNTNYLILGLIIQTISGQSYQSYIHDHIFAPLQMVHSFTSEEEAQQQGAATGYRWWFGVPLPAHVPYLHDALAAAFLFSSAEDMAHFLLAHLNAGHFGETQILSPEGIADLHRPQAPITPGNAYALGWHVEAWNGMEILKHGGETANWRAEMILIPKQQLGIVVLTNANNGLVAQLGLDRIAPHMVRLLLGQQPASEGLTFGQFYLLLDLVVVLLSSLRIGLSMRLLRRWHQPAQRTPAYFAIQAGLSLAELVVPLYLLRRIPKSADAPWSLLRLYVPDLSAWLTGLSLLTFMTGFVRMVRIFLKLQEKPEKNQTAACKVAAHPHIGSGRALHR